MIAGLPSRREVSRSSRSIFVSLRFKDRVNIILPGLFFVDNINKPIKANPE